ncbi:MAG: tRNA 2-thiouridine(34) synthase MnmA [Peptococcaceae bacterium]|jgi:tRNA-specific 2-thiouridylase|nr:tRNA 2-thiouridine(34) synthase MnmA [Peptococcaceae bacterium]
MSQRLKKKVVVGMSGGVDSSMTAALLQEEGYEVIGITMQVWKADGEEDRGGCCTLSEIEDARRVAYQLGIPHYVLNFRSYFKKYVVDYFIDSYLRGETPNPCLACNRYVKFDELLRRARGLGAEYIATGHYAKIWRDPDSGRYLLGKGLDDRKDQTYVLYTLTQEQMPYIRLPLGDYRKETVRAMAKERGLTGVANKPDSQEICFVPDQDYAGFIRKNTAEPIISGNFVDSGGTVLGRHQGLIYYTVGQRKGLGITFGKPMFVIGLNARRNEVVLGEAEQTYSRTLWAEDIHWLALPALTEPLAVKAKIRYKAPEAAAVISPDSLTPCGQSAASSPERLKVVFEEPQRAVTPGQAVVFYQEDRVLGGGKIIADPSDRSAIL